MGPNGAGKSTLSYVLTGRDGYDVTSGDVTLEGEDLLDMDPEARAVKKKWARLNFSRKLARLPKSLR